MKVHIDFETRSAVDLKKVGAHRYAEDPTTSVICMAYQVDDGPVVAMDFRLLALPNPGNGLVVAHNAAFERAIWRNCFGGLLFALHPHQQDCTLARAAAMGLPQSLEALGDALNTPVKKDKVGNRLMLKMCRPKTREPLTWHEDPADLDRLVDYCKQDVRTEAEIDKRLPPLSPSERRVWILDQHINDRGFAIDLDLVRAANVEVARAKRETDDRIWRITNGAVRKCTEVSKITRWLGERGIVTTTIAEDDMDDLVAVTDLFGDDAARAVLELRRSTARAFKFQAMLDAVCRDGRVRGSLAYHAAHTGRWAGRVVQPQNMKRVEDEEDEALLKETLERLQLGLPCSLVGLSLAARSMIVSPKDRKLVGGDFSNIEGRINAWLAGEAWKLDAFRLFDKGLGDDLYRVMAGRILDKEYTTVDRAERQLHGKVPELACGFQGGVGALQRAAVKAGVRMSNMQAEQIKLGWRAENPMIVRMWDDLNEAAIEAVKNPGVVVPAIAFGRVCYRAVDGDWLFCKLPSGRVISYCHPTVGWRRKVVSIEGDDVELNTFGVSYWGVHAGRWQKLDLYGGVLCNHVVQGTARDLLVEAMFRVEEAGYPIVLTVHDELLSEVDDGFGSAEQYEALMAKLPPWADSLPVAVKAWEGDRYLK